MIRHLFPHLSVDISRQAAVCMVDADAAFGKPARFGWALPPRAAPEVWCLLGFRSDASWDNGFIAAELESGHQLISHRLLGRHELDRTGMNLVWELRKKQEKSVSSCWETNKWNAGQWRRLWRRVRGPQEIPYGRTVIAAELGNGREMISSRGRVESVAEQPLIGLWLLNSNCRHCLHVCLVFALRGSGNSGLTPAYRQSPGAGAPSGWRSGGKPWTPDAEMAQTSGGEAWSLHTCSCSALLSVPRGRKISPYHSMCVLWCFSDFGIGL